MLSRIAHVGGARSVAASAARFGASSGRTAGEVAAVAAAAGAALVGGAALMSADNMHAAPYQFEHEGLFSSFDHASIRRGYQVYKEVCSTCHSVDFLSYRNLVGVIYPEDAMKRHIADVEVEDGPDDTGEMFDRAAKLSDPLPRPYPNEEAARAANAGALPPDLSMVNKARVEKERYIMSLLLGYVEPPEGVTLLPGLHYNPYFSGGAIAMEKQLNDGQIEYEDGTPATASQMAKDVAVFLAWASEPEHDERKKAGMKWVTAFGVMLLLSGFYKRMRWSPVKTRKLHWTK